MIKKTIFALFLLCYIFSACNCSYQYGVFVKNNTTQKIRVEYKSSNDIRGIVQESLIIDSGEFIQIISTKDLVFESDCDGCKFEHCDKVAEYINAYNSDSIPSKKKWCDKTIKFIKADIQQGEFVITYNDEDFLR